MLIKLLYQSSLAQKFDKNAYVYMKLAQIYETKQSHSGTPHIEAFECCVKIHKLIIIIPDGMQL